MGWGNLGELEFSSNSQQPPQPSNPYTERLTYPTWKFLQTHIKPVSLESIVEADTHTQQTRAGLTYPGDTEHPKDSNSAEPKQNQPAH